MVLGISKGRGGGLGVQTPPLWSTLLIIIHSLTVTFFKVKCRGHKEPRTQSNVTIQAREHVVSFPNSTFQSIGKRAWYIVAREMPLCRDRMLLRKHRLRDARLTSQLS